MAKVSLAQTSFLSQLEPPVPLDPHVVLLGDPRWDAALAELDRAPWHAIDTEWWHDTPPAKKGGKLRVDPWRVSLRLLQVSVPSGLVMVADLGGIRDDRAERLRAYGPFLDVLGRALRDRARLTIAHHLKGDALLLRIAFGFVVRGARCTMLLSQLYWAGVRGCKHSLVAVLRRMGRKVDKRLQASDWRGHLSNSQINYAAQDPLEAAEAYRWLGRRIVDEGMRRSAEAEMAALPAFVECEYHGLPVDEVMLDEHIAIWRRLRREVIRPFEERYPGVVPTQGEKVAVALTKDRCYGGHRFYTEGPATKSGKRRIVPTVGEEVLVTWDSLPWVNALMESRSIGVMDTYLSKIRSRLRAGRVRGEYAQIAGGESRGGGDKEGKGQGRSACGEPNLQNSPKLQPAHERLGGRPPREPFRPHNAELAARYEAAAAAAEKLADDAVAARDYLVDAASLRLRARYLRSVADAARRTPRALIVADLSQAHARIATQASQDATLLKAYREGLDVHCITASALARLRGLDWSPEHVAKIRKRKDTDDGKLAASLRDMSKPVFYGSLNMQGPATLQRTAATSPEPVKMSEDEARQGRDAWRTAYAGLYRFQRRTIRKVDETDVVIDGHHYGVGEALTGRRMFFLKAPDKYDDGGPAPCAACGKSHGRLTVKGTDVVASVWMRTEADIIKRAMGMVLDAIDAHPEWDAKLCNMAHDEINVDCLEAHAVAVAEEVQRVVHDCMRWGGIVDLPVDDLSAKAVSMIVTCWADK